MWLKMCPKCGGDLYLRQELDGKDIVCVQCGRARAAHPEEEDDIPEALTLPQREKRVAA